jgi:hypothetical protein
MASYAIPCNGTVSTTHVLFFRFLFNMVDFPDTHSLQRLKWKSSDQHQRNRIRPCASAETRDSTGLVEDRDLPPGVPAVTPAAAHGDIPDDIVFGISKTQWGH